MTVDLKTAKTINPDTFRHLVTTFGEVPTAFTESMTYYELLAWLCNYLEKSVIPAVNDNAEALSELQTLFVELHDYVENYFTNLDVQDEINNKLDVMAQDGTLAEIMDVYYQNNIQVIFPQYNMEGNDTLGDCSIIKTLDKVIMIDCFQDSATTFAGIYEALSANNITKIDYLILTHYHDDHIGNYSRLISSGLIDDALVILPRDVVSGDMNFTGTTIKAALDGAGISWELADNETINLGNNTTMKLFNASASDYQHYIDAGVTNYNTFSVYTEIALGKRKMLFAADGTNVSNSYVAKNYLGAGNYDLIKDCHHGSSQSDIDFTKIVNPRYVLVPTSIGMIKKNLGQSSAQLNEWSHLTENIYTQAGQYAPVTFKLDNGGITLLSKANAISEMGASGAIQYYVDGSTTDTVRSGSLEHPYKFLGEASCLTPKKTKNQVRINVSNLTDDDNRVVFNGFNDLVIDFANETPASNIVFENNKRLVIKNANLNGTTMTINNCSEGWFNEGLSATGTDAQIIIYDSKVTFSTSITFNGVSDPIAATRSNLIFHNTQLTLTNITNRMIKGWGNVINVSTNAVSIFRTAGLLTKIISKDDARQNIINPLEDLALLFYSSTLATTGTLSETVNNYREVKIKCRDGDGRRFTVICGIHTSSGDNNIPVSYITRTTDGNQVYTRAVQIKINDNAFSIDRNLVITHSVPNNTDTYDTSSYPIGVERIAGII